MQIDQKALDELERLKATLARIASPMKLSPSDIRPTDMAELAQAVARELRRVPILAEASGFVVVTHRFKGKRSSKWFGETEPYYHNLSLPEFDNLTPSEIVAAIQAEEAKKAAKWAGDT